MNSQKRTIVLATRNEDKLRELREICAGSPFVVKSSADYPGLPEVHESGTSALGNATRKALVTAGWTGEIAVADDTTFQVRQLGGMPDVFAARFAGPGATYADNTELVLDLMRDVPDDARDVRFETSMVWIDPHPAADLDTDAVSVAPARMRWVHDPFARRAAAADALAEVRKEHRRSWINYQAWFGTVPVGWGVDHERVESIVEEHVRPFLADEEAPPAGAVHIADVRAFTADGPRDLAAPQLSVSLPGEAPGHASRGPLWLELAADGRLVGQLAHQPLGGAGFGYDPVVVPAGADRTLAEMNPDEKNAISHRGRALRRLLDAAARAYGLPLPSVATG